MVLCHYLYLLTNNIHQRVIYSANCHSTTYCTWLNRLGSVPVWYISLLQQIKIDSSCSNIYQILSYVGQNIEIFSVGNYTKRDKNTGWLLHVSIRACLVWCIATWSPNCQVRVVKWLWEISWHSKCVFCDACCFCTDSFQIILPIDENRWKSKWGKSLTPICIQMAGTGDHVNASFLRLRLTMNPHLDVRK